MEAIEYLVNDARIWMDLYVDPDDLDKEEENDESMQLVIKGD